MIHEENRRLAGKSAKGSLAHAGMTVLSIGVVVLLFIIYLELLVLTIRILSGIASFFALIGVLVLGLMALSTPIAVVMWYRRNVPTNLILARFLLVSGVQGVLLFLSEVFRRVLLESVSTGFAVETLILWNHVALVAGLVVGAGGLAAGWITMSRYQRSLDFLRPPRR